MIVPVIGFESDPSRCTLFVASGTPCSMSAFPSALEKTILFFEAATTVSPGHFEALNCELTTTSSLSFSRLAFFWATTGKTEKNIAPEKIKAEAILCAEFLASWAGLGATFV